MRAMIVGAVLLALGCGKDSPLQATRSSSVKPPPALKVLEPKGNSMARMMKDSAQAPWQIQIHKGAVAGQYAVWEASGTRMWWGVTGTKGGLQVVEMRMEMAGEGWVTYAYVVDVNGTVKESYLADYDPEAAGVYAAYSIKIMEKQAAMEGDAPEPESGEEVVNAAGRDWNCKWYKIDAGGRPATTWMAEDDGWFTKIIKAEDAAGNVTMMLMEIGSDAFLGLKFPK